MSETKQLSETVTLSLNNYERLKEIEKKYFEPDWNALRLKNADLEFKLWRLNQACENLAQDEVNVWRSYTIAILTYLYDALPYIPSIYGYIKRKNVQKYIDKLIAHYSDTIKKITYDGQLESSNLEYIEPNEDIKLCKNETQIDDNEYYKLQQHLNAVVYNFLKKHDIPEGYTINYSIDNLPELAKEGITTPACDGYLGIMDANNNEIVASM